MKLLLMLGCLYSVTALADGLNKGLEIAKEMDRRDSGYSNFRVQITMTLRNRQGEAGIRELRYINNETKGDGDKSLVIFDTPRDLKGFRALTYSHKLEADDQWVFLPANNRTKRIASNNKAGPFMGSEFAYEDLGSQEVEKFKYRYVMDDVVNDISCFVLERVPLYDNSGYSKQVLWVDKQAYRILKIDYYDRKGELLKTLRHTGYDLYLGEYWHPRHSEMINHNNGKSTVLERKKYKFRTDVTEDDFSVSALKRIR